MKFYIIRHAQTTSNTGENSLLPMPLPNSIIPLTEKGKQQAEELKDFLNGYIAEHLIPVDKSIILTSSFLRTKLTAAPFIASHPHMLVMEDHALVEQSFGAMENTYLSQFHQEEIEYYHYTRKVAGEFFAHPPMGETPHDVATRIRQFLPSFISRMEQQGIEHIFFFGHGITNRVFIMELLNETYHYFEQDQYSLNTGIRLIDNYKDAGWIYLDPSLHTQD